MLPRTRSPARRRLAPLAWAFLLLLVPLACLGPRSGAFFHPTALEPDLARLYVYRIDEVRSSGVARIRVAGTSGGRLANRQYLALELPPGDHVISIRFRELVWSLDWGGLPLSAVAGETYYLRLAAAPMSRPRRPGALEENYDGPRSEIFSMNLFRSFRPTEEALLEIQTLRRAE